MAIIRDLNNSETFHTYLATVALFCGLSCTILMLKFRGFKATLDVSAPAPRARRAVAPQTSVSGAYRATTDEYFENNNNLDSQKQRPSSTIVLPTNILLAESLKPSKSTGNISMVNNASVELETRAPNVAVISVPSTGDAKKRLKEQKKLEKKRLTDEKTRQRLAAKERERQMLQAQQQAKLAKERDKQRKKKTVAPQPQQNNPTPQQRKNLPEQSINVRKQSRAPPPPQSQTAGQPPRPVAIPQSQNSTDTLGSSISRNSGPPPYADVYERKQRDGAGRAGSPTPAAAPSSWDMIAQHRLQVGRARGAGPARPPAGLQYSVGNVTREDRDNSEA